MPRWQLSDYTTSLIHLLQHLRRMRLVHAHLAEFKPRVVKDGDLIRLLEYLDSKVPKKLVLDRPTMPGPTMSSVETSDRTADRSANRRLCCDEQADRCRNAGNDPEQQCQVIHGSSMTRI
jgi:hypothetical protein